MSPRDLALTRATTLGAICFRAHWDGTLVSRETLLPTGTQRGFVSMSIRTLVCSRMLYHHPWWCGDLTNATATPFPCSGSVRLRVCCLGGACRHPYASCLAVAATPLCVLTVILSLSLLLFQKSCRCRGKSKSEYLCYPLESKVMSPVQHLEFSLDKSVVLVPWVRFCCACFQ